MLDQQSCIQRRVIDPRSGETRASRTMHRCQCRVTIFRQEQRQPSEMSASSFD
jgi:hypothetical protein